MLKEPQLDHGIKAMKNEKFTLFMKLWIIYLMIGPLLSLIPVMLFGVWAISLAMVIGGLLFGAALIRANIKTMRRYRFYALVGLLLPVCTFYLIPSGLASLVSYSSNPSPLWPAAFFLFTVVGFAPLGFRHPAKRVMVTLVALTLAVYCLFAEPESWFCNNISIPLDQEWSYIVNLTRTEALFSNPKISTRNISSVNGRLYWQEESVLVWNSASDKWEKTSDEKIPFEEDNNGLPLAQPYSQHDDNKRRNAPAKPKLLLAFNNPAKPDGRETRCYAIDMKQLYPEYDVGTTSSVYFVAVPRMYLPDGRLYCIYWLKWYRLTPQDKTTYFFRDQSYLQPGTLTLDLKSGKCEIIRGVPLRNSNVKLVENDDKLLVLFERSYGIDINYIEYDYEEGKWSKQEKFIRPRSNSILCYSYLYPDPDALHYIFVDKLSYRVRVPLVLLKMTGYTKPGEICYRRRNLETGQWSKVRKLSPGIKFVEYPIVAKDGKNLAVVWLGKQQGESMAPNKIPHFYYVLSMDGGDNWTAPQEIPVPKSLKIGSPKIFIAGNQLHLIFDASPSSDTYHNRCEFYHMTRILPEQTK